MKAIMQEVDLIQLAKDTGATSSQVAHALFFLKENPEFMVKLSSFTDETILGVMKVLRSIGDGGPIGDIAVNDLVDMFKRAKTDPRVQDAVSDVLPDYRPEIVEEAKRRASSY